MDFTLPTAHAQPVYEQEQQPVYILTNNTNNTDEERQINNIDFFENQYSIDIITIEYWPFNELYQSQLLVSPPYDYQNYVVESIIYKYINGKKNNISLLYGHRGSGKTITAQILASKLKNVYYQEVTTILNCELNRQHFDLNERILSRFEKINENDCRIIVINEFDKFVEQIGKTKYLGCYTNSRVHFNNFFDHLRQEKNLIVILTSEKSPENISNFGTTRRKIDSFYRFYRNNNTNNFNAIET